jgi:hypothetical protein
MEEIRRDSIHPIRRPMSKLSVRKKLAIKEIESCKYAQGIHFRKKNWLKIGQVNSAYKNQQNKKINIESAAEMMFHRFFIL